MFTIQYLLRNRNFILILSLATGLIWGQGAQWTETIVLPALAIVMTLSVMGIKGDTFRSLRTFITPALAGIIMNYVVPGGIIKRRPKATGKALRLFADDAVYRNYRYSCFVTSLDLPAEVVWRVYRMRADAENRIKELKYDFGADNFNVKNFSATEATINFVMLAYNVMSLFRQVVLGGKVQPTLKTMRYKVFAVGGYLIKEGNARILKLSMAMRRREWFSGLWHKSKSFDLPAHFASHL